MPEHQATFHFHDHLNDFLLLDRRGQAFAFGFDGSPAIKDTIEAIGVPHTEIGQIVVNEGAVDAQYRLRPDDRVHVYPPQRQIDLHAAVNGSARPAFVADVHLGRLVAYLRMLGFDTVYATDTDDPELAEISSRERRILLTRDLGLLKRRIVTLGYFVRETDPLRQLEEIIRRFDLLHFPMGALRCTHCNEALVEVDKDAIAHRLPGNTLAYYDAFHQCTACDRIYWRGSHYQKLERFVNSLRDEMA